MVAAIPDGVSDGADAGASDVFDAGTSTWADAGAWLLLPLQEHIITQAMTNKERTLLINLV